MTVAWAGTGASGASGSSGASGVDDFEGTSAEQGAFFLFFRHLFF